MKVIILAAGQGTRLRPLTDDRPKCMVEYQGQPIISHIMDAITSCGITDVTIVRGYLAQKINFPEVKYYLNERYDSTNMLYTLFCAEAELSEDDVIISYADIVYRPEILQALVDSPHELAVTIDENWKELWQARMEDPLSDAETLKINAAGHITELGKKPTSYDDIQGQYMGLIKIAASALPKVVEFYQSLDRSVEYDGKDFDNMYMTSFLQLLADRVMPLYPVMVNGGWIEIDEASDLEYSLAL